MRRPLLAALLTAAALAGCGVDTPDDGRLHVVAAFYPLEFLSARIGGDAVTVRTLTKPGTEPHDVELSPRQVGDVAAAGLAVHLGGFQPAVDDALAQEAKGRTFDAAAVVELLPAADDPHDHGEPGAEGHDDEVAGGTDPHVWLDPVRLATIADRLAARLAEADPAHAAGYAARGRALHAQLDALHAEFAAGLKTCARRELFTSHSAFRYLADRYGLTQFGISGLSPEAEPAPQRVAEVAAEAKEHGATTIFFETLVSPKVAETLAREVGARTAVLDPLEGLTGSGGDYFTVMRANLAALSTALGCSR